MAISTVSLIIIIIIIIISKAILQECKSRKKNVCAAWVDYKKAFDSVFHSWIIKSFELIGINNKIMYFTKKNFELMEDKYAPTYRGEDNRNRRFRNTTWIVSRTLTVTTVILL